MNHPLKLITELQETFQVITEAAEDGAKSYYIEGVWLQSNLKNRNGRSYPKEILSKEVSRYNEQYIKDNRAVGELGHPEGPTINQDRISHKILSITEDGDNFIGRAKIINTPMGKIVQEFIKEGIKFGVSSRGLGSLKENRSGTMEVQDDFYLVTAGDIVSDPSAPDAFVNGIMEGVEFYRSNGSFRSEEIAERAAKSIEESVAARELDANRKIKIFESYLNALLTK